MKRLFTLSAICVAMLSLVGCNSKQKAINEWIKGEVDHFVALEAEHPSLYYFVDDARTLDLLRVDLDTFEANKLTSFNGNDYIFSYIKGYILPEDRGYGGSTSFVITGYCDKESNSYKMDETHVALIYDTTTDRVSEICRGYTVDVAGDMIVSMKVPNFSYSITNVDVYDAQGNKLEAKTYVGTIAKQNVVVELVERNGALAGSYYYTKYGPGKSRIKLLGTIDQNRNIEVTGYNFSDSVCETWEGTIKDGQICATFKAGSRTYEFTLTEQK